MGAVKTEQGANGKAGAAPTPALTAKVGDPQFFDTRPDLKSYAATLENRGKTEGNWLALEKWVFEDMKKRGKVPQEIEWQDLANQKVYDHVASLYIADVMDIHNIPTPVDAIYWMYRPAYHGRYDADINKIPDTMKGSFGKTAKQVFQQRSKIPRPFNAEGTGYDEASARKHGLGPDETGHWPSREPKSGLILKGRQHKTWDKTMAADKSMGYRLTKKDGRYYSVKE